MSTRVKPIPVGMHTLTPHLVVKGASKAIEFYKKAFGAEEVARLAAPDGKSLYHADLKIGDSLVCTVLYVIPRTAILGAILLTGYLGGAIVTHLRVGDPFIGPIIFGVLIWAGLFLREKRLRALIPLRS